MVSHFAEKGKTSGVSYGSYGVMAGSSIARIQTQVCCPLKPCFSLLKRPQCFFFLGLGSFLGKATAITMSQNSLIQQILMELLLCVPTVL